MDFIAPDAMDVVHAEVEVDGIDGQVGGDGDVTDGGSGGAGVVEGGVGEGV